MACWDIFYALCHLLILPDLGPNCLLRLSADGTCIYKECGQGPLTTRSPDSQNHFHGIDQFAPVRHGGNKSRALKNCRYSFQYLTSGKRNKP